MIAFERMQRVVNILKRLSPGLRKALDNLSWLMFDRIVRMGLGLFVGVWVARYLGPAQFGSLNFALAFIALFGVTGTLGLDTIVIREVLLHEEETAEILGTSLALRLAGSMTGTVLAIIAVRLLQPGDRQAFVLVSILSVSFLFQSFDTIDSFFQSQVRSKITVWAKNAAFLIFAGIRVWLIYSRAHVWMFAAAYTGEIALGAAGLLIGYRLSGRRLWTWHARNARAILLLKQSWPVIFSSMAILIYVRLDTVMLKVMQGDFAVGIYASATRVSEVWYFIPVAIVSTVSPSILQAKDNPELFHDRLTKLFSVMTISACVIGTIVALESKAVIHLLYSNSYSGAGPILAVHVWASVFVFLGVAQSPWDLANDLLILSLYRTILGAVANALLNLYLIPKYSAMGAAIATVISYAISGVFANLLSRRTRPIFILQMRSFIPRKLW